MMSAVATFWASLVRTLTPIAVGWILGVFVSAGIPVDDTFRGAIEGLVTAAAAGIWYIVVRLLETYVTPKFGWLLGLAQAPEYQARHAKPTEAHVEATYSGEDWNALAETLRRGIRGTED